MKTPIKNVQLTFSVSQNMNFPYQTFANNNQFSFSGKRIFLMKFSLNKFVFIGKCSIEN